MKRVVLLFALSACTVERGPITFGARPDAGERNAGQDSGTEETEPTCLNGQIRCADDEYCQTNGVCKARPTTCAGSLDCAPGDVCTQGQCGARTSGCAQDADCRGGRCLTNGWCAPAITEHGSLSARCSVDLDCGPTARCVDGACEGACSVDGDCPGHLLCSRIGGAGVCAERSTCTSNADCYAGNTCANEACQRSAAGCTTDVENDVAAGAMPFREQIATGLTLCGPDVDWYTFALPARTGALLVVTSSRTAADLTVTLTTTTSDDPDAEIAGVARLDLPGISVIDIPGDDAARDVTFSVEGRGPSTTYAASLELLPFHCAGDALDILGDRDPARPLVVAPGEYALRACRGDEDMVAVDVGVGDRLEVTLAFGNGADLDVAILDASGATLASGTSTSTTREAAAVADVAADGRLFVRVISKQAPPIGAPYTLALERTLAARRAECAAVSPLVLAGGTAQATGTFAGAQDLGAPVCRDFASSPRSDRLYRVDVPAGTAVLRASVSEATRTGSRLSLALLASCESDAAPASCDSAPLAGRSAALVAPALRGPTYLLVSSEGGSAPAEYALSVTAEPAVAPSNDACRGATELLDTGTRTVSTHTARDDDAARASACGEGARDLGPDRFYRLELGRNERAALELSGPAGGLLWVGTSCDALGRACEPEADVGVGAPARVVLAPTSAQQYFVEVDGPAGDYALRVVRQPELECAASSECAAPRVCDDYRCASPPTNDACPGATIQLVDGHAIVAGSTGAADDQFLLTCAQSTGQADVAYLVSVPPGTSRLVARILEASFDPVLAVRDGTCRASSERACNDDVRSPDLILPEVSVESPDPGDYTLIIDAFSGRGPFVLEVEVER